MLDRVDTTRRVVLRKVAIAFRSNYSQSRIISRHPITIVESRAQSSLKVASKELSNYQF